MREVFGANEELMLNIDIVMFFGLDRVYQDSHWLEEGFLLLAMRFCCGIALLYRGFVGYNS